MSYDLTADPQTPIEQGPIRAAVASAFGVSPHAQLFWQHENEWVQVDLECATGDGDTRAAAAHEQLTRISIHAGLSPGWRTWKKIFSVAEALHGAADLRVLDHQRGQYLDDLENPAVATHVPGAVCGELSREGQFLFVDPERLDDRHVHLVQLHGETPIRSIRVEGVRRATFLEGGPRFLCVVDESGSARVEVRDPQRAEPVAVFEVDRLFAYRPLGRLPDGSVIDGKGYRYDAAGRRNRLVLTRGDARVALTSDGRVLVASEHDRATLQDLRKKHVIAELNEPLDSPTFSPDGRKLAASARGKRIIIVNAQTGKVLRELNRCGDVTCLSFVDDNLLASGARSSSAVRLWDLRTGRSQLLKAPGEPPLGWNWQSLKVAPVNESRRSVLDIRMLGHNALCVMTSDGQVTLWDVQARRWHLILGVRPDGEWLILAADGRWDASEKLDRIGWKWNTDARSYGRFWSRADAQRSRTPGLFADLLG